MNSILLNNQILKSVIIFVVFIIFLFGAIGIIEISVGQSIKVTSRFADSSELYKFALSRIVYTKDFIFFMLSGLLLVISLPQLSHVRAALVTIVLLLLAIALSYFNSSALIPGEYSLLTIIIIYMVHVLVSYFIEIQSKQKLMETFGYYIPPQLVNELSRQSDEVSLEGEAKTLTVFFCDLQNFTSISEELNPKQVNKLLNEYFTVMTEILFKYDGTIDKYIGDAIMAFWNAPTVQPAHAQRAVEAALEMDKAIKELAKNFIARGWPGPTMGTGINTGRASVGNMGSKYRMTYTAIGDAVNLASRVETLTRDYRVPIIISESTFSLIQGITCREIDRVRVKGKHQLTRIYEPLCMDAEMDNQLKEKLALHKEAIELYNNEKYKNAGRLFRNLYETDKSDKYYKVMLIKIKEKMSNHPE